MTTRASPIIIVNGGQGQSQEQLEVQRHLILGHAFFLGGQKGFEKRIRLMLDINKGKVLGGIHKKDSFH